MKQYFLIAVIIILTIVTLIILTFNYVVKEVEERDAELIEQSVKERLEREAETKDEDYFNWNYKKESLRFNEIEFDKPSEHEIKIVEFQEMYKPVKSTFDLVDEILKLSIEEQISEAAERIRTLQNEINTLE